MILAPNAGDQWMLSILRVEQFSLIKVIYNRICRSIVTRNYNLSYHPPALKLHWKLRLIPEHIRPICGIPIKVITHKRKVISPDYLGQNDSQLYLSKARRRN